MKISSSVVILLVCFVTANVWGAYHHADFASIPEEEVRERVERHDPDFILEAGMREMRDLIPALSKITAESEVRTVEGHHDRQERRRAEYAKSRHARAHRAARMALARMGDEAIVDEFIVGLSTTSESAKQDAIMALGYIGNKKAVKHLMNILAEGGAPRMIGPHELQMPPSYAAEAALGQILPDTVAEFRKRNAGKNAGFKAEWKEWWKKNKQKYEAE